MILTIETTLRGVAHMLHSRIAPAIQDPFAGEAARLAGMVLALTANWVDGAAALRAAENAQLRAVFADAAAVIVDAALAERVAAAALSRDPGLKISELDAESNRLRRLLVDLHAHIDASSTVVATAFSQRIWRLLADLETARAPQ